VSESWGTQKRTQKTFKPTLFVPFRRTQKFHHNEARAPGVAQPFILQGTKKSIFKKSFLKKDVNEDLEK
jgi:hypothetical protein